MPFSVSRSSKIFFYRRLNSAGSLAMFAAIRRASSRVSDPIAIAGYRHEGVECTWGFDRRTRRDLADLQDSGVRLCPTMLGTVKGTRLQTPGVVLGMCGAKGFA
jgi:hypothetical protein